MKHLNGQKVLLFIGRCPLRDKKVKIAQKTNGAQSTTECAVLCLRGALGLGFRKNVGASVPMANGVKIIQFKEQQLCRLRPLTPLSSKYDTRDDWEGEDSEDDEED